MMKSTIIFTVFALLSLTLPAQHTWYWCNPYPDGYHLNDIWFTSADHGWAVGNGGKLIEYDGQRWTGYERLTFQNLNALWFTDENHGWAAGNNGVILKYTDGSWIQSYSGNTKNLRDVCFTDENNGWAVGDVRMHYDGNEWTTLDTIGYGGLTEVFFTDVNHGWCGGFDKFYKYDSTGWHWFPLVSSDIISVNSLYFADQQHGWIGGYYGDGSNYIMKYDGLAWTWMNTHPPLNPNALYFENPAHGWSCGGQTYWYLTDTTVFEFTGSKWIGSYASKGIPNALAPAGLGDLYVATQYGHILRKDAAGWGYSNTLAEGSMELAFPDTTHGWAVGNGKNILKFENGTWKADTSFSGKDMQHLHFADSLHGIASGWSAGSHKTAIYRFSGNTWHLITDTINMHINAIVALPNGDSWFSGNYSSGETTMYHLSGNTLEATSLPGLSNITAMSFSDIAHGWAIGTKTGSNVTQIIRFQGSSWVVEFTAPSNQTLLGLSFSTQNSGWAVGKNADNAGITYHFDGLSWSPGPGTNGGLRAVHHPDANHAYAVGSNAVYTLTANVWEQESLDAGQALVSVVFPSPGTGWVGGEHGGILSTRSSFLVAITENADNQQTGNLLVFPNPATTGFIITIPTEFQNEKRLTLSLYNSRGELIHNESVITSGGKITMSVREYVKGLYQVSLGTRKRWYSGKVVVD
jgi:hypothetical protein